MRKNRFLPVENKEGIYRDSSTRSLVNTNKKDFDDYIANRKRLLSDKQRINDLEVKVDSLKDDIGDIKNLLLKIVDK